VFFYNCLNKKYLGPHLAGSMETIFFKKEDVAMSNMSPSEEPISGGQIIKLTDVIAAGLRKSGLPGDASQQVIESQGADIVKNFVADFSRRVKECQRANERHLLQRKPFNPREFTGYGGANDERVGKRNGDTLDAGKIITKDYLQKGEYFLYGEERLYRIKTSTDTQLDGEDFLALWEEEDNVTLRWLYEVKGITSLLFFGLILRPTDCRPSVLRLYRRIDGSWGWNREYVDKQKLTAENPAAVLESSC
jgi:hypothetical protein